MEERSLPNTVNGPNFLNFEHKLVEGVIRYEARVSASVKLDQIAKILHLTAIHKFKIRRPKVQAHAYCEKYL